MLDNEFRPAYEVAYNNSTAILGVTETLDVINEDVATWRSNTTIEGKSYSGFEFWTDDVYDLYYYNVQDKVYKANGVNLLTQLGIDASALNGMTVDEKNEYFKTKRREAFKTNMGNYWHQDDCIFHYTFCMMFAATDNFKKNSYPYKFASLSDGGKWRWRQDDLDTIFDINNQGFSAKLFSVLVGDQTSTGSGSVFRGDNSIFWTLIGECFKDEIKDMVHRIMSKMDELSPYGQSTLDRCVGYIKSLFWDKAQEYFGEGSYNADAEWTYEEAWYLRNQGKYNNDVHPLQQSLGSHYEAERDWVELRIVFLASYFNFGPFAVDNGDDTSTGQISFRAASGKTYTITPAIDLNPTILIGQSTLTSANERVKAGTSVDVIVDDMGNNDTHIYIQGADYYSDLGDLSDIQVSADNPVLTVSSKRLRKLKAGDEIAENVTSNVATLTVGDCPCMEEIDARNLTSLAGTVNLSQCPRLKKAHFSGTNAANVQIPEGSKLTELSLPGSITTLSLIKLLNLTDENLTFDDLSNIAYIRIENNNNLGGFELLKNAYENSSDLTNIRIVGFDAEGDATDVDMIAAFATATDENGNRIYYGIDDEGNATVGLPILDGSLTITSPVYSDTLEIVTQYYPNLEFAATVFYVRFADPEVERIVAENWGDGTGTTLEQIQAVTSIGTVFNGNTVIETFDEFEKFTGVTGLSSNAFNSCASLTSIKFSENITNIGARAFYKNTSLVSDIYIPNLNNIGAGAFEGCSSIERVLSLGAITEIKGGGGYGGTFDGCSKIKEINIPSTVTKVGMYAMRNCSSLEKVELGDSITNIGHRAFEGCSSLKHFLIKTITPPTLDTMVFNKDSGCPIYVPDASVEAYKTATNWVTYADRIMSMFYYLGYIDFVDSAVRDICVANFDTDADGVVSIEEAAAVTDIGTLFRGNTSITSFDEFKWFTGVTSLVDGAFNNCNKIKELRIPDGVTQIGGSGTSGTGAISKMTSLETLHWGKNITKCNGLNWSNDIKNIYVYDNANYLNVAYGRAESNPLCESTEYVNLFVNGVKTTEFVIPEGVTNIPSRPSVLYKLNINKIHIPASLTTFNLTTSTSGPFLRDCPPVEFEVDSSNESFTSINGVLYNKNVTTLYRAAGEGEELIIPSSVTYIVENCVSYSHYKKIKVHSGITRTGGKLFSYNDSLKTLIWESTTNLPQWTVDNCESLETILIKADITNIGNVAFTNCSNLRNLIVDSNNLVGLTNWGSNTGFNKGIANAYVQSDLVDSYKTATTWSTYEDKIKPINVADTLPDIGSVAENDLYKIGEVYWKAELVSEVLTWVEI